MSLLSESGREDRRRDRLEQLYNRYKKSMLALAGSVLHDPYDAEDAVHSVFLNITGKRASVLDSLHNEQDMKNYLMAAVRNTAINMVRDRRAVSFEAETDAQEEISDPDFTDLLCDQLEYEELLGIMKALPSPYKEVLYFRFVLELKPPEISRILKQPAATIRKQAERGKILLIREFRKVLDDHDKR